jgi:hypothetical protein
MLVRVIVALEDNGLEARSLQVVSTNCLDAEVIVGILTIAIESVRGQEGRVVKRGSEDGDSKIISLVRDNTKAEE